MERLEIPEIYESGPGYTLRQEPWSVDKIAGKDYKLMFGLGLGFVALVLVTMLSQIYVMSSYKNMHPLRQHSPRLMIISSIGNLFLSLMLLVQNLMYSGCNMQTECPEQCKAAWTTKLSCVLGFLCFVVFEPMAIIPYWARTIRIYKIFKAQQYYFEQKKKPSEDSSFRWIKEQMMIRASAVVVGSLLVFSILMIIVYLVAGQDVDSPAAKLFFYLPSYSVYVCYMNGMCDQGSQQTIEKATSHINAALIWIVVINFLGNMFFVTCIYKLRGIKKEFNIRVELITTFLAWFISTQTTMALVIYQPQNILDWLYLIFVGRSLLIVVLSGTRPLFQTIYKQEGSNRFILLPPNQESIESLDMVLQIPIATDYFYEYLNVIGSKEDQYSIFYFSLYADLRKFDRAVSQGYDTQILIQQALVIKQDYLDAEGDYFVDVRPEVLQPTLQRLGDLQRHLTGNQLNLDASAHINNLLFIELLSYVLDRLKYQFEKFKRSPIFVELEEEISRQEKLYEILVDASIITN